jgi:hypothetical protein
MAERPEDLNLPNAVVTRIIKDAVSNICHSKKKLRFAVTSNFMWIGIFSPKYLKYRITSVLKVETDIITCITASPTGRAVLIYVKIFKTLLLFLSVKSISESVLAHDSYELT